MTTLRSSTTGIAARRDCESITPSVAILCDYAEERWPSMDLIGDMLSRELAGAPYGISGHQIVPHWSRLLTALPGLGKYRASHNADRLFNRFQAYPRQLRPIAKSFDLFQIVDHSYAHLVHFLPPGRSVVYCHDLDAFEAVLRPGQSRFSLVRRRMASRTLSGLRKAALVVASSRATFEQLSNSRLTDPARTVNVPLGVHPAYSRTPSAPADTEFARLAGNVSGPLLLHVGSTIPRKRIDVLLRVFAGVRLSFPNATLLRAGGEFTRSQNALAAELRVSRNIVHLPFLNRETLAAAYRGAALVLVTSETEGFGLPVIESLACGTPVVASNIAPLHEGGGEAAVFQPVGDIPGWVRNVVELLRERAERPLAWKGRVQLALDQAGKFSWPHHAAQMSELYHRLLTT